MKNTRYKTALVIGLIGLFFGRAEAQDQPLTQEKREATIGLSYYKSALQSKTVTALIKAKNEKGKFAPAKNVLVNFYEVLNQQSQLLQGVRTNTQGEAVLVLQNNLLLDADHGFTIVAKIENDNVYEDAEEEIHYTEVNLRLDLNPNDTARLASIHVTKLVTDGKEMPVSGVEVKIYVQRLFGNMSATEENIITTDENGAGSYVFPDNIPGDTKGAFTVVAKIEDDEQYGNVENKAVTHWGIRLALNEDPFPRSLWASYAPLPLIITLTVLFGGVWFAYFFIIFQLHKIKQETIQS